jgi:flagellar assembly protein FliH
MSKMWERADFWPAERAGQPVADDFARGVAEGRRTVELELVGEREAILQLAGSLDALQSPSSGLIAALIVNAVERLVTNIVGNAPIDAALLRERAEALSVMLAGEAGVVLALHPEDAALLERVTPVVADALLARGTVQARAHGDTYEDGVMPALDRLRGEIARLGIVT